MLTSSVLFNLSSHLIFFLFSTVTLQIAPKLPKLTSGPLIVWERNLCCDLIKIGTLEIRYDCFSKCNYKLLNVLNESQLSDFSDHEPPLRDTFLYDNFFKSPAPGKCDRAINSINTKHSCLAPYINYSKGEAIINNESI